LHRTAIPVFAEAAQDVDRIGSQQCDVEENDGGVDGIERSQRILCHVEVGDPHAKLLQRCGNELPQLGVVVDDERKVRINCGMNGGRWHNAPSVRRCGRTAGHKLVELLSNEC
jgi:hypothetical protein